MQEAQNESLNIISRHNDLGILVDNIIKNNSFILNGEEKSPTREEVKFAKLVAKKLAHNEDRWPYQLQLMCNAWISEKWVEDNLREILTAVNRQLGENRKITFLAKNGRLKYRQSTDFIYSPEENSVDFVLDNDMTLDVKVVKREPGRARSFHNADLVIIFSIDRKLLYFRIKQEDNSYSKPEILELYALQKAVDKIKFVKAVPEVTIMRMS